MGWYSNSVGCGSNQWKWFGHRNPRGGCDKFNSDDYDDQNWVCRWLGTSHGDVTSCSVDSNIWSHDING